MSISFLLSPSRWRLLAGVERRRDRNPQDNAAFEVFNSFIQIGRLAWGDVADRRPRAGPRPKNAEEKAHKCQGSQHREHFSNSFSWNKAHDIVNIFRRRWERSNSGSSGETVSGIS